MKIKLQLLLLAACGTDPVTPPPTPPPATTTPTISGVFPDSAFVGRDARIEISGDATHWTDGTTVAFGAGVTVSSVAVASPTSLFADITVGNSSAGLSDVTVTGPDGMLVLHAGLDIEPPLALVTTGTLAQGSIITVHVANLDFDHPFDTSTRPFAGQFPNLEVLGPPGVSSIGIDTATAFELVVELTIDVDALPGELVINSGPPGHATRLSAGNLAVMPRTAIPLTANTITAGGAVDKLGTVLYEFTPAAVPAVTLASIDTGGFLLLTASGHFEDAYASSPIGDFVQFDPVTQLSDKYYLIYGDSPYATDSYDITLTEEALGVVNETATNNNTGATAQAIQVPAMFENAALSSNTDQDFVTFPITAADLGKTVRVMTEGNVSTVIDVFADKNATISLGESAGAAFDDFTSSQIPDGTTAVYVKFSAADVVDPEQNDYFAAIFLTAAE